MNKELEARQALHMIERSVGEHGWFGWEEVETLETAINELEELRKRNKPMKVIKGTTVNGVCLDYECPSCKQEIDNSRYSKDQHYLIKYCISCGQKLDWSDDEKTN